MVEKRNAGLSSQLKRRITIVQANDSVPDGQGGTLRTWTTVPGCNSVPAKVEHAPVPKKGNVNYMFGQEYSNHFYEITIRFKPSVNINNTMQVLYGTKTLKIRDTTPDDEDFTFIKLQCEELLASGSTH